MTARILRALVDASPLAAWPFAVAVRAADGSTAEACGDCLVEDVEVGVDTVMYAASIAKQVIGILAAQQAVDGSIDTNHSVSRYIDGLPPWGSRVRLRHLIHHTSGVVMDESANAVRGNDEVLSRLRGASMLLTEPGSNFRYSNVGYVCLAEVLSCAGGQPVESLARDLFASLLMNTARLGGPMPGDLPGQQPPPATVGDGGLWLSTRDLRRWNDAMNDRALGDAAHALAEQPGELDDGTPLDYAWGIRIFEHQGRRTVSHGGSWPTWSAKAIRQPDAGVSVAILTTCEDAQILTAIALDLVDALPRSSPNRRPTGSP